MLSWFGNLGFYKTVTLDYEKAQGNIHKASSFPQLYIWVLFIQECYLAGQIELASNGLDNIRDGWLIDHITWGRGPPLENKNSH